MPRLKKEDCKIVIIKDRGQYCGGCVFAKDGYIPCKNKDLSCKAKWNQIYKKK